MPALPEELPGLQIFQQVLSRFFRLIGRDVWLLITQILVADAAISQFVWFAERHVNHKLSFTFWYPGGPQAHPDQQP